jgi:hypothetical protein
MIIFNMLAIFVPKWTIQMCGLMPAQEVPSVVKPGTNKTAVCSEPFYFHDNWNESSQEQVVFMRNKQ